MNSDKNRKTIDALVQRCIEQTREPHGASDTDKALYESELRALTNCICGGAEDASHIEQGMAKASDAHYEQLARELIEFVLLRPHDALRVLPKLIWLMELTGAARTNEYKMKQEAR